MSQSWKPDDLVGVKSGGPTMTVARVDTETVFCEWFDASNPRNAVFSPTVLEARLSQAEGMKRMKEALDKRPPRRTS
jgi:uncharacterized protein YodC (DUF2158 family)